MTKAKNTSKYDKYGIPPFKEAFPLGFQHLLAMYVSSVTFMLIVSKTANLDVHNASILIQSASLVAAVGTLVQILPIKLFGNLKLGSDLPVFLGLSHTFLGICMATAANYGIGAIIGAQIVGGIASIIMSLSLKKILKLMPPVVTGTVVLAVGISLFPVSISYFVGGKGSATFGDPKNFIVAGVVLLTVIILGDRGKGIFRLASVMFAVFVGYIVSIFFGMVDFSPIKEAAWIGLPKPLAFGIEFRPELMITFIILYFVNIVEMIGDMSVSAFGGLNRYATDDELRNGCLGNSIMCVIGGFLNCFPLITYSGNSGIVALNKVISRHVFLVGAITLFLIGLVPKFSVAMLTIPPSVIGGATVLVFAMITMSGVNLLTKDGFTGREMTIAGISLTLGAGIFMVPDTIKQLNPIFQTFLGGCIAPTTICAIILNLLLKKPKEDKPVILPYSGSLELDLEKFVEDKDTDTDKK